MVNFFNSQIGKFTYSIKRDHRVKAFHFDFIISTPKDTFTEKLPIAIPIQVPFNPILALNAKKPAIGTPIK